MNVHVKLLPAKTEAGQVFDSARPDVFAIGVGVGVGVAVGVCVGVLVDVLVAVLVGVCVGVGGGVGVAVDTDVGVRVGPAVGVMAGVGVQAKTLGEFVAPAVTRRPARESVALTSTLSVMKVSLPAQAGATSFRIPVQVAVALPFGPRVVTGLPFWLQATAKAVPPGYGTVFVADRLTTL
jgi:hypothetical protein